MPLNTTELERLTQAAIDLALKLKLERRIIVELRELFRQMTDDLRLSVQLTGSAPNAQLYSDDFLGILSRQSRRVSAAFSDRVANFLYDALDQLEPDAPLEEIEEDSIAALFLLAGATGVTVRALIDKMRADTRLKVQAFNAEQSRLDAATITRTNQKQMDAAVAKATADLLEAEPGVTPSRADVAKKAAGTFKNTGFNRVNTIASTFSQKQAENTKDEEREEFFNLRNGFGAVAQGIPPLIEIVIWQTEEDELVRHNGFNHVAANQQVRVGGFFTVSGEQLRKPGDPNGSMGNIAGCRCAALIIIR